MLLLFGVVAFLIVFLEKRTPQNTLNGIAYVSDGDSLKLKDERIRLLGIDAPELAQTCVDENKKTWQCGKISKKRMKQLIKNKELICTWKERDRYNRLLAKCTLNGNDIGAILVKEGLAVSYRGSNDYLVEQKYAKKNKIGMWAGKFEDPKDWRFRNRGRRY